MLLFKRVMCVTKTIQSEIMQKPLEIQIISSRFFDIYRMYVHVYVCVQHLQTTEDYYN